MKTFLMGLSFALVIIAGCAAWQDSIVPAKVPTGLSKYVDRDPNKIGYQSKDKLETIMAEAKLKNITTQAELEYLITKDKAVYSEVAKQAEFYQRQAEATAQAIFGQNGLLVGLLGLVGGGVAARMYSTATLYNKEEVKAKIETAVSGEREKLYTQEEVDKIVVTVKSSVKTIV